VYAQYYSKATIDWCIKIESFTDYTSTLLLSDKQREKNLPHQCWFQLQKHWNIKNKNVHKCFWLVTIPVWENCKNLYTEILKFQNRIYNNYLGIKITQTWQKSELMNIITLSSTCTNKFCDKHRMYCSLNN